MIKRLEGVNNGVGMKSVRGQVCGDAHRDKPRRRVSDRKALCVRIARSSHSPSLANRGRTLVPASRRCHALSYVFVGGVCALMISVSSTMALRKALRSLSETSGFDCNSANCALISSKRILASAITDGIESTRVLTAVVNRGG